MRFIIRLYLSIVLVNYRIKNTLSTIPPIFWFSAQKITRCYDFYEVISVTRGSKILGIKRQFEEPILSKSRVDFFLIIRLGKTYVRKTFIVFVKYLLYINNLWVKKILDKLLFVNESHT